MILTKFLETLFVFCEISLCFQFLERNFAKFCQILNSQKAFAEISRNFAKHFLYFAKFCRVISFAKEISPNFVKYLFCDIILPKFRKIFQNIFLISRNFVAKLVLRNHISQNFAPRNLAKFREIISKISRNQEMKISRNFVSRNFRGHPTKAQVNVQLYDMIRQDTLRQDRIGYNRIRQDMIGYDKIQQDTTGYDRIR